ncbi:Neuropeptide Y receptor [Aphelenchoides fujianensis]|nr:Neuropeptide Y receptor [Aphelenchoides fujianensis]
MPLSYWHVLIFEDQRWIFGGALCKIFNFLQAVSVFLSSWTLVVISFDRFLAICFLMKPWLRLNMKRAALLILATWLFSSVMALPLLIVNQTERSPDGVEICQENWKLLSFSRPSRKRRPHYCLPLLVLVITYTWIGLKMWNSKVPGSDRTQSARFVVQGRHDSVKKLVPMVLLVSALYAGCWLPQNLLMNLIVVWAAHSIAMFHSTVNPVVYYFQNRRLREGLRYMLSSFPCVRFDGLHHLEEKPGARAVKIVNLVAYMPARMSEKSSG